MENFDFWRFFAGLGIFLFGVYTMEDSVRGLAGRTFKRMVGRYTKTRWSAIGSGIFTTSILQSSSAISMMALAFVGAGILSLENAVGVIIGSNIGTTFTAWIVAFFGFKLSIESFALPLIGIGGLGLIISSHGSKYFHLAKLLVGFGFLFHGLGFMKASVETIASGVDLSGVSDYGNWVFVLVGLVLTALMQSSSATIAIILTAINSAVIPFVSGEAMVIGANIGTTVTVLIGAVGGVPIKKRVAVSHLIFNLTTGLTALLLLPVINWLIVTGLGWQGQPVLGIALFHTLFNVLGMCIFIPVIPVVTSFLNRTFPEPLRLATFFIHNTSSEITEAALTAFRKEIIHQYCESREYLVTCFGLDRKRLPDQVVLFHTGYTPGRSGSNSYENIKKLHGEIFEYYARIHAHELSGEESKVLELYLRASRSIMNATKNLRSVRKDLDEFEGSENDFLNLQTGTFNNRLENLFIDLDLIIKYILDEHSDTDLNYVKKILDQLYETVVTNDALFIGKCSEAIGRYKLTELQVTSLLMANRLFTQSCRMVVLSLEALLSSDIIEQNTEMGPEEIGVEVDA